MFSQFKYAFIALMFTNVISTFAGTEQKVQMVETYFDLKLDINAFNQAASQATFEDLEKHIRSKGIEYFIDGRDLIPDVIKKIMQKPPLGEIPGRTSAKQESPKEVTKKIKILVEGMFINPVVLKKKEYMSTDGVIIMFDKSFKTLLHEYTHYLLWKGLPENHKDKWTAAAIKRRRFINQDFNRSNLEYAVKHGGLKGKGIAFYFERVLKDLSYEIDWLFFGMTREFKSSYEEAVVELHILKAHKEGRLSLLPDEISSMISYCYIVDAKHWPSFHPRFVSFVHYVSLAHDLGLDDPKLNKLFKDIRDRLIDFKYDRDHLFQEI